MPLVEQYSNWKSLEPITGYQNLTDYFYSNTAVWQQRPESGFFAECKWYKFPYCCAVPWYEELNSASIIGSQQAIMYRLAKPLFDHAGQQLGDNFLFWGAELNSVPPDVKVASHYDKHFYSDYTTRVHIVLKTNDQVDFIFENSQHHFNEGECFVFNNKLVHSIENKGSDHRLHLVMDFVPREVFKYVERSIAPFGGHLGTKHILAYLNKSNPAYSNYIQHAGAIEIYPSKTQEMLS